MLRRSLLTFALIAAFFTQSSLAQEEPHPAEVVATTFLKAVAEHDWDSAADLVVPSALERQKGEYILMIRRAPALETEEQLLARIEVTRLREVEALTAKEFYVRNRKAVEAGKGLSEGVQAQMKKTFELRVLGTMIEEEDVLAHVLSRTSHETFDAAITERILLALEKDGESGNWLVSPNRLKMDIRRLESAGEEAAAE